MKTKPDMGKFLFWVIALFVFIIFIGVKCEEADGQLFQRRVTYEYQYEPTYTTTPRTIARAERANTLDVPTDTRLPGPRAHYVRPSGCTCPMCHAIAMRSHLRTTHSVNVDRLGQWHNFDWYLLHDNLHNAANMIFEPTPHELVAKMIEITDPKPGELFLDLGSGDGRILIAAAKHGCDRVVGYELKPDLVRRTKAAAKQAGVHVTVNQKSFLRLDLSGTSVVTLYLGEPMLKKTVPLLRKLPPGARVVSYAHPLPGVDVQEVYIYPGGALYFYYAPIQ